ncbi:hypothetical protein [Streptomyces fodineus]|uniref:hypothetical protein n=1 Tax=Streptomyces fodineus TaxID=1904616 RepID=UPI003AADC088
MPAQRIGPGGIDGLAAQLPGPLGHAWPTRNSGSRRASGCRRTKTRSSAGSRRVMPPCPARRTWRTDRRAVRPPWGVRPD